MNRKLIIAVFAALLGLDAHAATYYVGVASCSDSYTTAQAQNLSTPYCTLQHGNDVAAAGDTILVKDGIYTATNANQLVSVLKDGAAGKPITFRSLNKYGAKLTGMANFGTL